MVKPLFIYMKTKEMHMNRIKRLTIEDEGAGARINLYMHEAISPEVRKKVQRLIGTLIDVVNDIVNLKSETKELH